MFRDWRSAIKWLLLAFSLLVILGLLLGELAAVLALGMGAYIIYTLFQLRRLHRWLSTGQSVSRAPPPETFGLWGFIYDGIYHIQRRERKALEHLKNIIDKAQDSTAALEIAVVMIDSKGRLEWWNPAAEKLLGLITPKDKNQLLTNLIREPRFLDYFQKETYVTPLQLPSPVDNRLMLEYQITRFGEGERLILIRDISQLHRLEMMRKDFVANVSHELRTPITVITGYLETLLDQKESIASRWIKPIEQMYQQSRRMENIIRDLLTLSQLETKSVSRQQTSISVASFLREIKTDAEQLFPEKNHRINIECEDDCELAGNISELYSAISNLVFNAAKYTQNEGLIILRCIPAGNPPTIEVIDNGPGIAAHHIPRLTERFYRVDESRSTDTGGTGLGLAIVKHVLARHSANLVIASTLGKGSHFTCQFPAERLHPARRENKIAQKSASIQ
ncbi:MAG: phosphate regulon sensor histidine kinase PhoR [Pseudomonadales bacterium]|nr:phosphate regulon sensor histidine kinase PhoR [Pseudomonadales bacterium]